MGSFIVQTYIIIWIVFVMLLANLSLTGYLVYQSGQKKSKKKK